MVVLLAVATAPFLSVTGGPPGVLKSIKLSLEVHEGVM